MSAGRTRTPYFTTVSNGRRALDLAALAALFSLALLGFQHVYGGIQYLLTGMMALVLGLLIALIGARFRWGALRVTALLLGVYLVFGTLFAAPTHALFGVVPTLGSLRELLLAPVTTWRSVLTVSPPVGAAQGVLGVVWISTLLLTVLSASIVLRTRRYVAAWLFPLLLILVTVTFGTTQAFAPALRGIGFAVTSVAWLTWRFESARLENSQSTIISDTVRPGSWKNPVLRRRLIGGSLIMVLAVGGSIAARPLLDPPPGTIRYALRDQIAPPFDPQDYVSPLADFRGYTKNRRDAELFSITGVSEGDHVRLATMDRYDLHVYNVAGSRDKNSPSGAFLRTAGGVNLHEASGQERTSTVTIGAYNDVWMPTIGARTNRIELEQMPPDRSGVLAENLFLNEQSQTAVNASGMRSGDTYELRYEPYRELTVEEQREARFAALEMEDSETIDPAFAQLAEEWAGTSASDYERFQNLSRGIKADAFYSNGIDDDAASLSGHGAARLLAMLEEVGFDEEQSDAAPTGKIGDEEQFAALTALMAQSIGIPARVVMGFEIPAGTEGTAVVTGEDVTAWVEVAFEDHGWVRFDPAPDEDEAPTQPEPNEVEKPLPQVAQPPPPPAEPPSPPPGAMSDDSQKDEEETPEYETWVVYALFAVIPVLLVLLVLVTIVVAKLIRRRRRRLHGATPVRIDGGWQEILDLMTDLGYPPNPVMTRQEVAAQLEGRAPAIGAGVLASRADRASFGPDDLPEAAVDEYWAQIMAARQSMAGTVPWHRRLRAVFSLRSFRRRGKERRAERRRVRATARARARADRRAAEMRRRQSTTSSTGKTKPRRGPQ